MAEVRQHGPHVVGSERPARPLQFAHFFQKLLEGEGATANLGIQQAGNAAKYVKGIAVYADWTTDADEWSDFQKVWSNAQ